ncbi:hypothetical protein [Auritidibacter ignavus]|uniref:hypothetical protein n=1 Tax=Auritidibacter ignavus TaxID=678932 RepID=UPI0024473C17|nr:hypothetical protein [Auritidibacter ignavus]WGH85955.1 hypothetical protein QDX24_10350 [Auritidibacter ignavus]WGH88242.1 hypothetical protein QDX22_10355 [Auritidibacter ignavus]
MKTHCFTESRTLAHAGRTVRTSLPAHLLAGLLAVVIAVACLAGVIGHQLLTASSASAAPQVAISGLDGQAKVRASGITDITVSGRGFQSLQGGFGGIYVAFGWVDDPRGGSWKPSQGGKTGVNYMYVPDTEAKDNNGYLRFVTFPGSSTASAANGGTLAADGTWKLTMRTPGAKFNAVDRQGNQKTVDCTKVTCGIITIGAHGVHNPSNESFTPVEIVGAAGDTVSVSVDDSAAAANRSAAGHHTGGGGQAGTVENPQQAAVDAAAADLANGQPAEQDEAGDSAGAVDAGQAEELTDNTAEANAAFATVGLQQEVIQAGHVLGFTGQGFQPGEQVVVTLGDGSSGAGPLTAGATGEVAGAIPIPDDASPGTHTLRLTGASSEQTVEAQFTVAANATATSAENSSWWSPAFITVLCLAAAILIFVIVCVIVSLLKRRRARATVSEQPDQSDPYDEYDQQDDVDPEPELEEYDDATQMTEEISASHDPYATVPAASPATAPAERLSGGGRHRHLSSSDRW